MDDAFEHCLERKEEVHEAEGPRALDIEDGDIEGTFLRGMLLAMMKKREKRNKTVGIHLKYVNENIN